MAYFKNRENNKVRIPLQGSIKGRTPALDKDFYIQNSYIESTKAGRSYSPKRPGLHLFGGGAGAAGGGIFGYEDIIYEFDPEDPLAPTEYNVSSFFYPYVISDFESPYNDEYRFVKVSHAGSYYINNYFNGPLPHQVNDPIAFGGVVAPGRITAILDRGVDNADFEYKIWNKSSASLSGTSSLTVSFLSEFIVNMGAFGLVILSENPLGQVGYCLVITETDVIYVYEDLSPDPPPIWDVPISGANVPIKLISDGIDLDIYVNNILISTQSATGKTYSYIDNFFGFTVTTLPVTL